MYRRSILALLFTVGLIRAANMPPPVALDPKVHDVLAAAAAFYAAKKSMESDIVSTTTMSMTGMKQEMDSTFHLALARPDSFSFIVQSGMMGGSVVTDGKTMVAYEPVLHKYTSNAAPDDLAGWLQQPMNLTLEEGGLPLGFEALLAKDPITAFSQNLRSSQDLGEDKIGGVPAHHVRLVNVPYITDLWFAEGTAPTLLQAQTKMDMNGVLKKMTIEQKKKMPPGVTGMTMSRLTVYTNWKFDQSVPQDAFVFHPPADAQLVADFAPPQPPSPLLGKPAPDFTLSNLDGKSVPLSSLRGHIVVLDFWATWCGPCVATLPTVIKVTSSLQDKGVVFYGINLKENADAIRKFQAEKSLAFPVLLDSDGKIADLYKAKAIPQSVLIDKDGKIQAVHVGYSPTLKGILTQQLTDMLAGKNLVSAPAAASAPAPAAPPASMPSSPSTPR